MTAAGRILGQIIGRVVEERAISELESTPIAKMIRRGERVTAKAKAQHAAAQRRYYRRKKAEETEQRLNELLKGYEELSRYAEENITDDMRAVDTYMANMGRAEKARVSKETSNLKYQKAKLSALKATPTDKTINIERLRSIDRKIAEAERLYSRQREAVHDIVDTVNNIAEVIVKNITLVLESAADQGGVVDEKTKGLRWYRAAPIRKDKATKKVIENANTIGGIFDAAKEKYTPTEIVAKLKELFPDEESLAYEIERLVYGLYDDVYSAWGEGKFKGTLEKIQNALA